MGAEMSKIMQLADAYAFHIPGSSYSDESRAALQAEVERMEAECAQLAKERQGFKDVAEHLQREHDALKAEIAALREDAEKVQSYVVMPSMRRNGIIGTIEVSLIDNCLHGRLVTSEDLITYEGNTPEKLLEAFKEAVDKYLDSARSKQ
jgi:FtsZ-binding cell division protein ZapB/predicted RNase H-like HicB family nuclease